MIPFSQLLKLTALWIFASATTLPAQPAASQPAPDLPRRDLSPEEGLQLEQVLQAVRTNNALLKAAAANWEAMKRRIPQARAWEDTMVGVDIERMGTTRFDTFTDNEWMIAQEIPITGKNRLRGKAALAEAAAAFEERRRRELDLIAQARTSYYNLANAWQQLALNDRNAELLKQFVTITRAKYESGTALQSDMLIAETDLAKLQEARFDLEREISDAEAQLNGLMNLPADHPLPKPPAPAFFDVALEHGQVESLAFERRPELLTAQLQIQAAQARYDLARRDWIPDPEVRLEARQFNGRSGFQEYDTGIFFKFPWGNYRKYQAAVEEAREMKLSAEHTLEGLRRETSSRIREQLKKIETFHHHARLFRDRIVPLARQNVSATRSAYESDKGDFINLIDAQRTFYEVESMYWRHVTTYLTGLAELEAWIGAEIAAGAKAAPQEPPARR